MEKKEVKKEVKKIFLLDIINDIKDGKNPSQISKERSISKQKLNYYIRKLKEKQLIRRLGYGTWGLTEKGKKSSKVALDIKEVRGHAFMWKIKLPKVKNWEKRIQILEKININYKLIGAYQKTPAILFKDRKIWLGNKFITIYEPESFIANTSFESRRLAINKLLEILTALEDKLKVSFKINGNYQFKVSRQHYSLMKNILAIQCNKEGEKIYVYDKEGLWFLIDNSYNFQEAETVHPKTSPINNYQFQKYMNSHKETNFKVTPDFILNQFSQLIEDRKFFAENQRTHIKAIQELGKGVKKLTKAVEKKDRIIQDLELRQQKQTKLSEF